MIAHVHLLLEALKKRKTFKAVVCEPRRICCGYCHEPFVHLVTDRVSAQVETWRGRNADQELAQKGGAAIREKAEKLARRARVGVALCPHCGWYQDWMVRASRRGPLAIFATIGAIAGIIGAAVETVEAMSQGTAARFEWSLPAACLALGVAGGVALSFLIGAIFGVKHGAHPGLEDPSAITESAWQELVAREGPNATRVWAKAIGRWVPKHGEIWALPLKDAAALSPPGA